MATQFTFNAPRGRSGRRRLIYATLLVIVVFALDALTGGNIRELTQRAGSSLWKLSENVRRGVFDSGYFRTHRSLAEKNAQLRAEIERGNENAASYIALKQENEILRSLLQVSQDENGITVPVVSSMSASPYGTFLIGAGRANGMVQGSLVLTPGGFVVGVVSEVREKTSLVREVFAGAAQADVLINGAAAPAEGRGGGNARVAMPRGIAILEGDPVIAPLFGGRPVGVVGKVDSDSSNADQTVYVVLPINISSLRFVHIVPAN